MPKVSHRALKTYQDCPRRYKYIYIDDLSKRYAEPQAKFTMGQHVHLTLKKLLAEIPVEQRTTEKAAEILRTVWRTNRKGFASREEEANFGKRALAMLDIFIDSPLLAQPKMLEEWVEFAVADNIVLFGRIDRLDEDSAGAMHLIDYKTGESLPERADKGQLLIYSALIRRGLDLPLVTASYWYLEQNEFVSIRPTESDIDFIIEEILRTTDRIKQDTLFTPTPSYACKWCEFIDICPAKEQAMAIKNGIA